MRLTGAFATLLALLLLASPAVAAPTWLPPQTFEAGLAVDPAGSDVAVTPNGTAIAVWVARVGTADLARARVRLPGQGFGPTITLTPTDGRDASNIHVATDAQGNATLAWEEENGPGGVHQIRATRIPAGSEAAETPKTVSIPGAASTLPAIGVGASGVAVIAYTEGGPTRVLRAVTRNGPAGDFGPTTSVSGLFETGNADPVVGVADDGSAVIAWQRIIASMPSVIEANDRPPNGDFGNPMTDVSEISNTFFASTDPALAIAPDGTTVVLWTQAGSPSVVAYNERTPAGTWLSDSKVASKTGQGASRRPSGWTAPGTRSPPGSRRPAAPASSRPRSDPRAGRSAITATSRRRAGATSRWPSTAGVTRSSRSTAQWPS